ncbi:MAG: hypothetical protein ACOCRO_01190 [Halanaerobiales bacterium]
MNLFEKATREKLRFSYRGSVSVEDLWDLPVEELDKIYKGLNSELKKVEEDSLLGTKSAKDKSLELKVNIIKYIVETKLEEKEKRAKKAELARRKQKILEIMESKKEEQLKDKSLDELEEMINSLEE